MIETSCGERAKSRAAAALNAADKLHLEVARLAIMEEQIRSKACGNGCAEEVTQHHCHDTLRDLFDACKNFIDEINRDALAVVRRLWPRFDLDPEVEKLGFSS